MLRGGYVLAAHCSRLTAHHERLRPEDASLRLCMTGLCVNRADGEIHTGIDHTCALIARAIPTGKVRTGYHSVSSCGDRRRARGDQTE